jgi:hypothetical protein
LREDSDDERNRSMEAIDSDELEGAIDLSDDEEQAKNFRSSL